jgi:hypothetical protein
METEAFVTKVLHTLTFSEIEKSKALTDAFVSARPGVSRIKVIQLIVQYCEYVLMLWLSLLLAA